MYLKDRDEYYIYYPSSLEEKQLRVHIAHEIGHLLVKLKLMGDIDAESATEPLSSIIGYFIMLDKNDFYENKIVPYRHDTPQELLADFCNLCKG